MGINATELKLYKALTQSNENSNGGRMSTIEVSSGSVGNLFANATAAERAAGSLKYRKVFFKNTNVSNLQLIAPYVYIDKNTAGDSAFALMIGTQSDTQGSINPSGKKYAMGTLNEAVIVGATELKVLIEDTDLNPFAINDVVRITDKINPDSAGNETTTTITQNPTISGNIITLTVNAINTAFAESAKVANLYILSDDLKPSFVTPVITSTAGVYAGSILLDNNGAITQTWTVTFTSSTNFTIEGDTVGAVAGGTISTGAEPLNPANNKRYFKLLSTGFSGAWLTGDTLVFSTGPAAIPIWIIRKIPLGSTTTSTDTMTVVLQGETD